MKSITILGVAVVMLLACSPDVLAQDVQGAAGQAKTEAAAAPSGAAAAASPIDKIR